MLVGIKEGPKVHLMHGFIGMGKTFFANKMSRRTGDTVLSIDQEIVKKYGRNISADNYQSYHNEFENEIFQKAIKVLKKGSDIIIDHGFWRRQTRDTVRKIFDDMGVKSIFYNVKCADKRWKLRMADRNNNPGPYDFIISENDISKLRKSFEPMTSDERFVQVDSY